MAAISPEQFLEYAYASFSLMKERPHGIVINCHGFSDNTFFLNDPDLALKLAEENILYVFPYYNDSGWANPTTIAYIDLVLDCVYQKYGALDGDLPLVVSGGSMGGLTAFLYALEGRYHPVAVAADCPVSDLRGFFSIPHTLRYLLGAYADQPYSVEQILTERNPIERVADLPKIPYLLVAGTRDGEFPPEPYQKRFVDAMRTAGHDIGFYIAEGMLHCDIRNHPGAYDALLQFYIHHVNGYRK